MTRPKLPGQAPTPEQEEMIRDRANYWRHVGDEAVVQTITRIEEAAKQLIGLNAVLQGIYFAVFAFSDLRKQIYLIHISIPGNIILLILFLPILCWLISLYCSTRVFVPQLHPGINLNDTSVAAWQNIQGVYKKAGDEKGSVRTQTISWQSSDASVMLLQ